MIYVALLRGINVGGNNKVDMKKLKTTFERVGFAKVKTYINSGNVIFEDEGKSESELVNLVEEAIKTDFGFEVKVLVRDRDNINKVVTTLPSDWVNDASMKCDVMFLWPEVDSPEVIAQLLLKPGVDEAKYVPRAILWRVDRDKINRSGMLKLVGTKLYKQMTIRNCNTVRKLATTMTDTSS